MGTTRWLLTTAIASMALPAFASAEPSRAILPIPPAAFTGTISDTAGVSKPAPLARAVEAPAGAPNILLFMNDDVGFGMTSTFGGPVPTPNLDRLARVGQRYNRFHTTAICSATRASLLTGRNHHAVGTGYVSDVPVGYPGYDARIPDSAATIAQTLRLNGYNTAMFGKHHNVPSGEDTAAGPFDRWPTGLGFEHFYGIIHADTDQWHPNLYRGTDRVAEPDGPLPPLDRRLADAAITWIHNQKAAAPDKPFFVYVAPGSVHAPHQAPPEYIARFKGKFDQGWDKVREETHRRQIAMGIIPRGTKLTPRPNGIIAWDSLDPAQKAFAARSMEVAAAMLSYQDEQAGRIIDEVERMGLLDNTLIAFIEGDNGAEASGKDFGTLNEIGDMSGTIHEDDAWRAANLDKLGGPDTYGLYPAGWAWAMNAPLRWGKQYTSTLGGIRNGMVMAWEGRVARSGGICSEFGHVVDMAPTFLEAAGIPAPRTVYGVPQQAMNGKSLLPSLAACQPDRPRTQYFEMVGKLGLYHNGWFAGLDDGRLPWVNVPPTDAPAPKWELYDLSKDFSQSTDLAAQHPERTAEMAALWKAEAMRNNVFPLDHRFAGGRSVRSGPPVRKSFDFWGKDVSLTANRGPTFAGRSFTITADLQLDKPAASGVVTALGSKFAGWSLFLDEGRPVFVYANSTHPDETIRIEARQAVPAGASTLKLVFISDGVGKSAAARIQVGDAVLAEGRIPRTFTTPAGLGETLDIGRDLGVAVAEYRSRNGEIDGDILRVNIKFD